MRSIILTGLLILSLCLSTCAPLGQEEPEVEPVKLKVLQLSFLSFAPFFIAQEEGYFAEQDLEIEFVKFEQSSMAILPLAQGELDVLAGTVSFGLLSAMAREGNIRFVAGKGHLAPEGCTYTGILARPSLLEGDDLSSPDRLRELRMSIHSISATGYFAEQEFQNWGLTLEDIESVDLISSVLLQAFADKSIDLAAISEPWLTRLTQSGQAALWVRAEEVIPDFQLGFVAYGPSLLDENRDAGRRFMAAYLKAIQQYNEGKTERNLEILNQYTGLDLELLKQMCWPSIRQDGTINVQSVLDFQAWALENDYLDSTIPVEQFWEPAFVENIND
jgi:NitT/TauT family transport system substrate-binding protein